MTGRKFDWKPNHDPKSKNYRAVTAITVSPRRSWTWQLRNPVLDQGQTGACVGHGVINAASTPHMQIVLPNPQQTAFGMYYGSRYIDEWPGEDYDGTSVNAGCKLAVQFGLASGYKWCFGVEEVAQTILEKDPVIIGIKWRDSMFETSPSGKLDISGQVVGGHCVCVRGFSRNKGSFLLRNSWGRSWGISGDGIISYDDLGTLLEDEGEAAILVPVAA